MADRALPDLKSRIAIDTSGLAKAEAQAKLSGVAMGSHLGAASGAAKNLGKDLEGMGKSAAGGIPILGSLGGSIGGLPIPALAAAAAVGGLVIAGKSMIDISDKWEAAQLSLKQATDATGESNDKARTFVDTFITSNRKYVSSQADVVDSYAAFIRQGISAKTAQQDMNLALDLAAIKHISLTAASSALQKMEAGKGKALIDLGIVMKDYPVLMEDAHAASLKLEAAEAAVTKATLAHTAAVKAHGAASAQAKTTADALAKANVALADAHNYAANRAAASTEIHDLLQKKLAGGRQTTSELTQTQNQLGNVWQSFSEKTGPALTHMMAEAEKILIKVVTAVVDAITVMGTWKELWAVLGNVISIAFTVFTKFIGPIALARAEIILTIAVVERLVGFFQKVVDVVRNVIDMLGKIKVPSINLPFGIGGPAGRAAGGPVVPGQIYRVNENTPNSELFSPSVPGNIIPSGGAGGGDMRGIESRLDRLLALMQPPSGQTSTEAALYKAVQGAGMNRLRGLSGA